jgi:hypothetical protein
MIGNGIYTHIPSSTIPSYLEWVRTTENDENDWSAPIGGRLPYWLYKFSPEPDFLDSPIVFSFKRNMRKNLIQFDFFPKQSSYQFSTDDQLKEKS